jgi:hypothetical protein
MHGIHRTETEIFFPQCLFKKPTYIRRGRPILKGCVSCISFPWVTRSLLSVCDGRNGQLILFVINSDLSLFHVTPLCVEYCFDMLKVLY